MLIAAHLNRHRMEPWIAPAKLVGDENWWHEVRPQIEQVEIFLLLLDTASADALWHPIPNETPVRREVDYLFEWRSDLSPTGRKRPRFLRLEVEPGWRFVSMVALPPWPTRDKPPGWPEIRWKAFQDSVPLYLAATDSLLLRQSIRNIVRAAHASLDWSPFVR